MLCYVMLCYVMLCYVMLCYVMLCYVMLCYVMLCYVMLCYVMLGTGRTGQIFVYLRKNLSPVPWDKCARWFFDLTNFVKPYQTSKASSYCLGAGQIFVRREIWQICQFTRHDSKGNVNQENLISIFSRSLSVRSPPKLFHICAAIKRWRWEIRTSGCCMTIITQNTTVMVPKFTFQLHLQVQVLFNFYIPT